MTEPDALPPKFAAALPHSQTALVFSASARRMKRNSVNQDPRLVAYRYFPHCNPAALALLYFVGAPTEPPASARPDTNNPVDKMTSALEIVMKILCIGSSWLKGLIWVSLRCNIAADLNPSGLQQPYVNARR